MAPSRKTPARRIESLRSAGFTPRKSMGQNFLIDPNLLRKIADAAKLDRSDVVVEIGSGPGTLTEHLAERVDRVISVELDEELLQSQKEKLTHLSGVEYHHGDFLEFDLSAAAAGGKLVVVGNIPYHVTSPMILKILTNHEYVDRALLLMQKEVAERLAAPVGNRSCGRLTVAVSYRADVKKLFHIGRNAFSPRPRVDSTLLGLYLFSRQVRRAENEELLFRLVAHLFQGRRKMIRTGLRTFADWRPGGVARVGEISGISLTLRPEELMVDDWCTLSDAVGSVV